MKSSEIKPGLLAEKPRGGPTSGGSVYKLLGCIAGIYASFLTWGILQERIATTPYGPDDRIFRASHVINIIQGLMACLVGYIFLQWKKSSSHDPKWAAPIIPSGKLLRSYLLVAACQSLSSPLAYASMAYVDYLTILLAKSGKLLPVMAVHLLLYRRRFPAYKYAVVLSITAGVAIFSWRSSGTSGYNSGSARWGFALLALNLFLDGLYNTTQDEMFRKFNTITGPHMMFFLNLCTTLITVMMLLASSQILEFRWFMIHHPQILRDILLYGLCGALGQVFIFITLAEFGSMVLVTATVTRKMFSMLLSVFLFNHSLLTYQWLGVGLVFGGVAAEALAKRKT